MTEYERGFIDGIKSKVSAELTPTLINVSKTMLEMLKPVLSTALENAVDLKASDVQPVKLGRWIITDDVEHFIAICSECGRTEDSRCIKDMPYCHCGARMDGGEQNDD